MDTEGGALAEITDEEAAAYRAILARHADNDRGSCRLCGFHRCFEWTSAAARLIAAGRPLVAPTQPGGP